jgi:hypothetical protein
MVGDDAVNRRRLQVACSGIVPEKSIKTTFTDA